MRKVELNRYVLKCFMYTRRVPALIVPAHLYHMNEKCLTFLKTHHIEHFETKCLALIMREAALI